MSRHTTWAETRRRCDMVQRRALLVADGEVRTKRTGVVVTITAPHATHEIAYVLP